jgi:hypothetical protein
MNVGYGSNSTLHLAFETVQGVLDGTPHPKKLAFVSEDIKGTQAQAENMALSGDPNPLDAVNTRIDAAGPLVLQPGLATAALFWKWILGNITTTGGPGPAPYVHTSKLQAGPALTASLDILFDLTADRFKRILGAAVDQVTIGIGPDGFLQHQLTVSGFETAKQSSLMTGTPHDFSTDSPLHHGQIAAADILIDSAVANLSSFNITLNLNLDKSLYVIGGLGKRVGLGRQRAAITGQIRAYLTDDTLWGMLKAQAFHNVSCKWTVDADHTFTIDLPRCLLQPTDPSAAGPGAVMLDFSLRASKDPGAASAIVVTTSNDEAGTDYS